MKREPRTPREDPCNLCVRSPPHLRGKEDESKSARTLTDPPIDSRKKKLVSSVKRSLYFPRFASFPRHSCPEFGRLIDDHAPTFINLKESILMLRILIQSFVLLPSIKNFVLRLDLYIYTFRVYFHRLIKDRGLNIPVRSKNIVIVYFGQHFTSID